MYDEIEENKIVKKDPVQEYEFIKNYIQHSIYKFYGNTVVLNYIEDEDLLIKLKSVPVEKLVFNEKDSKFEGYYDSQNNFITLDQLFDSYMQDKTKNIPQEKLIYDVFENKKVVGYKNDDGWDVYFSKNVVGEYKCELKFQLNEQKEWKLYFYTTFGE